MANKTASMKYQPKPHQGKARKEQLVAELSEKVQKSQAFVFVNYQGLTHLQLEAIKKTSKKLDADFVAVKNTLMLRALSEYNLSDEDKKNFEQPTATLFIYGDIVEPLKNLAKTAKELDLPKIKFGIIEKNPITAEQVLKLATLPPLPQLRAQLLGMMMSPIQGLHRALSWNMQTLVMTLNAIAQKKA
ncbi:MAG: 50S ribosomal protein L10 [Candidatus Levybacteria bacterium]|nr:50S ribosomal protein L10 [Candidatus Levybacteria bacterium]